jgi:alkylhydroperoxidase family enzyme
MPEPLLNRVARADMPENLRALWDMGMERTGEADIIEVFANHPAMLDWYFNGFYKQIFYNENPAMKVDVRTKEILRLKLSKQHGCQFCNRANAVDAVAAGISQAQIENMRNATAEHFDEKDLALIELADNFTLQNMNGNLSRDLYDRLRRWYDDAELVEIGFICAVLTGMAKFIFMYDLVTKEEVCPIGPVAAVG